MSLNRFSFIALLILPAGVLTRILTDFCVAFLTVTHQAPNVPLTTLLLAFATLLTTKEVPSLISDAVGYTMQLLGSMIGGFLLGRVVWIWRQSDPERSDYYTYHLKWIAAWVLINLLGNVIRTVATAP
jgi:hypothetical protein